MLRDFRRRMAWADEAGRELYDQIIAFAEQDPHALHVLRSGRTWTLTFVRQIPEEDEASAFEGFARLIGAYLDNARAALNYLAVAMVDLAYSIDPRLADMSLPKKMRLSRERIEFPIFVDRTTYERDGFPKVRALPPSMSGLVTESQPFGAPRSGLWILHELAREYRHRVIHPAAVIPRAEIPDVRLNGEPVTLTSHSTATRRAWRDGDTVMTFTVGTVPEELLDEVHPRVKVSIGLDHPLCTGRDATDLLSSMTRATVDVAQRFEPLFR